MWRDTISTIEAYFSVLWRMFNTKDNIGRGEVIEVCLSHFLFSDLHKALIICIGELSSIYFFSQGIVGEPGEPGPIGEAGLNVSRS